MIEPQAPPAEKERLATLRSLQLLDTPPEARFDRLTEAARKAFGVPVALVSLVDEKRQWFKSRPGLEVLETPRSVSFCGHAILRDETLVVPDALLDERFFDSPLVTGPPHVRFYAGHPLTALDGSRVGTLCILDTRPRTLSAAELAALHALAARAEDELSASRVRLGSFQLLELIGRGGMGIVYKARDEGLGRIVALKIVHRDHASDPEVRERFRLEGRALASVSHPNVLTVFFVGEEHRVPFLVSEFLPNGSLEEAQKKRGRVPWPVASRLGSQVAHGLKAIHGAGLVHRDVKPGNILLDAEGRPKLADFGLVGVASRFGQASSALLSSDPAAGTLLSVVTEAGVVVGTPAFMAPEQLGGSEGVDWRADLYGFGATLYALVTGQPPFTGSVARILASLKHDLPRSPRELVPELPEGLARLVLQLLEKDPARRPATALEIARALETVAPTATGRYPLGL